MKFIDESTITIESGKGGNGCIGFRREKFIPKGGPDGGDGGRGGSVYLRAVTRMASLLDFREKSFYKAENGQPGRGQQCTGRSGVDLVIDVPIGTKALLAGTDICLVDLTKEGQQYCIAEGGDGGLGNTHFKSSRNQTPYQSTPGGDAIRKEITLELQVMADCGLLGMPNAGKSSLISNLSRAHPKVADYAFTTTRPHLGIMMLPQGERVVIADIPGLLEGAHTGHGMGNVFLRHVSRCRVLIEVIDIAGCDGVSPLEAHRILEQEIKSYKEELMDKPRIIVLNKADIEYDQQDVDDLLGALTPNLYGPVIISCKEKQGMDILKEKIRQVFQPDF